MLVPPVLVRSVVVVLLLLLASVVRLVVSPPVEVGPPGPELEVEVGPSAVVDPALAVTVALAKALSLLPPWVPQARARLARKMPDFMRAVDKIAHSMSTGPRARSPWPFDADDRQTVGLSAAYARMLH
jgi:hypothetical protein